MIRTHRIRSRARRRGAVAAFLALLAVVSALVIATAGSASSGPPAGNATAQGRALVQQFFTLLQRSDTQGLKALLAPSFQVVRANGDVQGKTAYLADPPKVARFTVAKLKGTKGAEVLVVSYQVKVTETITGSAQPKAWAPRLSVFQWQNGAWHLSAHANFGAIEK